MLRLWKARQGNFTVIFGLVSFALLGGIGTAIDYSRAINVQSFMQGQADAAALSGVHLGSEGDPSLYLQFVRASMESRFGPGEWIDKLDVTGKWISDADFEVIVKGEVPVTILAAVPGFPDAVTVAVSSTARMGGPTFAYKPPRVSQLDPEASDYNRISVYCYDPAKRQDPATHGRTQMTVIADNAGSIYDYSMPHCSETQYMSYRLTNVRDARSQPSRWDDPQAERYDYYTDSVLKSGKEVYGLKVSIIETVLCDTFEECKPRGQGGIIPEGKERTPQLTKKACAPGKFMYYGWEDRPPGSGWTDQDYDDIRIIIECPSLTEVGERIVRLID